MAEPARNLEPEQPNDNVEYINGAKPEPKDNRIFVHGASPDPEPGQEESQQPIGQKPNVADRAIDAKDTYDQGKGAVQWLKKRFGRTPTEAGDAAGELAKKESLQGVEKKTAQQAGRKVATQGAKKLGGAAAQAGTRAAGTVAGEAAVGTGAAVAGGAAAGSVVPIVGTIIGAIAGITLPWLAKKIKQYWKVPLIAVAGIVVLGALVLALLAGKGIGELPTTDGQKTQVLTAAYLGGDFLAGRQLTDKVVEAEKQRYQIILKNVSKTIPARSVEVKGKVDEITTLMEQTIALSGEPRKTMTTSVIEKVKSLDSSLPFGKWIAAEARLHVGQENTNFCRVGTGADSRTACASFTSTVLELAGVPAPFQAATEGIWNNKALKLIVPRSPSLDKNYFEKNKASLQEGDIIWWGDGKCGSARASKIFNHVGFYVGNGLAIDTSSEAGIIPEPRDAGRTWKCSTFNGAKRYGANL